MAYQYVIVESYKPKNGLALLKARKIAMGRCPSRRKGLR